MKLKIGLILSGLYVLLALYLILTQGLMGESFIALILGLPWTLFLAAIEFGGVDENIGRIMLILPMVLNAVILFCFGSWVERRMGKRQV